MTNETHCLSPVMPAMNPSTVMPALVAGIHVFSGYLKQAKTWMAGTSPAMTNEGLSSRFLVLLVHCLSAVMPAPVAGTHVLRPCKFKDVDGRNKSGHDEGGLCPRP